MVRAVLDDNQYNTHTSEIKKRAIRNFVLQARVAFLNRFAILMKKTYL